MKIVCFALFLLLSGVVYSQSNPAQWLSDCIEWTTKNENAIPKTAELTGETDLRSQGFGLLRYYVIHTNNNTAILLGSFNGNITSASYQVDYNDKTLFESHAVIARQLISIHNGYLKSKGRIDPVYGGGDIYEASIEGNFSITIQIINWGSAVNAYGAIHVSVYRKQ
jgi:hypothetical protein